MKRKVSELQAAALDWAVAKCDSYLGEIRLNRFKEWEDKGRTQVCDDDWTLYSPSTDWAQGGPIIERERILLSVAPNSDEWTAIIWVRDGSRVLTKRAEGYAPTPLVAAMRCYVASKLASNASGGGVSDRGDEIEIPDELL